MRDSIELPWVLRGHERGPERFASFEDAVKAVDTWEAAICAWIEGPNGVRLLWDGLTAHRAGWKPIAFA
ncbi:hypothetical protein [Terricaulis sp.]|uniref:hypothetical protein n=1 Tax=Terricaulis sp. TaxID=2768686 RepID=UPI002AC6F180|nr:hypothetical protein [Terricaulis sp.]MDZ4693425.1 hypothetical protein [Terricaulis sp.]